MAKTNPKNQLEVERVQDICKQAAESVVSGTSPGMAAIGPGGLGKSYTVEEVLRKHGIDPDEAGEKLSTRVSPKQLYLLLYRYRNSKVILLDDVEKTYRHGDCVDILRSALWGSKNKKTGRRRRIVQWNISGEIVDADTGGAIPKRFEITAGIILIGNSEPADENEEAAALMTRLKPVRFYFQPEAVTSFLRKLVKQPSERRIWHGAKKKTITLTLAQANEIIDFLAEVGLTHFRALEHAMSEYVLHRKTWKRNVQHYFEDEIEREGTTSRHIPPARKSLKEQGIEVFLELQDEGYDHFPITEKVELFQERTAGLRPGRDDGYARSTWFDWMKKYRAGNLS